MGLKIAPAEFNRWQQAGLIPTARQPKRRGPPADHRHLDDGPRPTWRVALLLSGLRLVSRSNTREHWSTRYRRDKSEAATVRAAWLAAGLTGWPAPLPVAVTLARIGGKPMDGDNLQSALKAIRDAVAGLVGVDDGDKRIHWRYRDRPDRGAPSVTITIRPRWRSALN